MKSFTNRKGFTLVEIMIAGAIGLIVMTITLRFVIQTMKTYQYETGKLLVNRDIRKFTTQMVDDATYANSFQIYDQCSNLSRTTYTAVGSADPTAATYQGYTAVLATTAAVDPDSSTAPGSEKVGSGRAGDVLTYIYYVNGDNTKIQKLIVYYRWIATAAGDTSSGTNSTSVSTRVAPLYRLVVNIPTAVEAAGIMKLLPDITATTKATRVFEYVDGQANDVVPTGSVNRSNKMFYNSNGTSILIRGRIYENYTAQRIVKSTYNFTVTPRG